jgi:hypothetical protein
MRKITKMKVTYEKLEKGVYNFAVNFKDEEMLGYDEITSEVKCALLEFSTDLNTPDFIYEYETHHGPTPQTKTDADGNEITVRRVDKVEFFYIKKGNSEIILDCNFSIVSGHFKFDKIELKYSGDLSNDFLDNTAKQIKVIVEHLFNQSGKLCVNCVRNHKKELLGSCDFEYQLNPLKKI